MPCVMELHNWIGNTCIVLCALYGNVYQLALEIHALCAETWKYMACSMLALEISISLDTSIGY